MRFGIGQEARWWKERGVKLGTLTAKTHGKAIPD